MRGTALVCCAVLLGCGTTQSWHVVTGHPRPATLAPVGVLMEGNPLPARWTEIAIVEASGRGSHANLEDILAGLRGEARMLGANAVIHVRFDMGASMAVGTGVAIRTGEGAPAPVSTDTAPHTEAHDGAAPWGTAP